MDDGLQQRAGLAVAAQARALAPTERLQAQALLNQPVDVELIFARQITQPQIDAFLAAGGEITHIYRAVSYGWNGRIPLGQVLGLPAALGANLLLLTQAQPMQMHMDMATRTGRVRPVWAAGYAGNPSGFDGDTNITVAIVDTGVDESHTDLNGRRVYWHDFTPDGIGSPVDMVQHGSHVAGIALGTGAAGGAGTGTLLYTQVEDYTGEPSGIYYPNPISLPSTQINFVSTVQWTGGGTGIARHRHKTRGTTTWTIDSSTTGTSPVTHATTITGDSGLDYTATLTCNGSMGGTVIINQVPSYPGAGDGFNKLRGVAPGCRWAAAKVFQNSGSGLMSYTDAAIDDLVASRVAQNVKVMNLSLGVIGDPGLSASTRQKVNTAVNNGIVMVISAGNDGLGTTAAARTVDDPGRAAMALTVAAANDVNALTDYTSQGFTSPGSVSGQEEDYKPDVMAPGGSSYYTLILSVDSNSGDGSSFADQQTNDYLNIQGTSMACPFTAGCAALLIDALQQRGFAWDFTSSRHARYVKMVLCATATESNANREDGGSRLGGADVNPTLQRAAAGPNGFPAGKDQYEGYGMINPDAAVEAVWKSYTIGSSTNATLGSGVTDQRAWARSVNLTAGVAFAPALSVPAGGDFDLYLYSTNPSAYGTPVTLTSSTQAGADADETFSYTPASSGTAMLVVKRVSGSGTFTLSSLGQDRTLDVYSAYGMADPPVGQHTFAAGTPLVCSITNSPAIFADTQSVITCVCTGWTGTGSVPVSGTTTSTPSFSLLADSTITWRWVVTELSLSNQVVAVATNLFARDAIRAADGYRITAPGNVTFQTGTGGVVRLAPGFTAASGSVFRTSRGP